MTHINRLIMAILFATGVSGCAARKEAFKPTRPYVEGEVIVQYKDGPESMEARDANAAMGATVIKSLDKLKLSLVQLPPNTDTVKAVVKYRTLPGVVAAEPNYVVSDVTKPAEMPPVKAPAAVKKAPAKKSSAAVKKKAAAPKKKSSAKTPVPAPKK